MIEARLKQKTQEKTDATPDADNDFDKLCEDVQDQLNLQEEKQRNNATAGATLRSKRTGKRALRNTRIKQGQKGFCDILGRIFLQLPFRL